MSANLDVLKQELAEQGIVIGDDDPIRILWILNNFALESYKNHVWELQQQHIAEIKTLHQESQKHIKSMQAELLQRAEKERQDAETRFSQTLEGKQREYQQHMERGKVDFETIMFRWSTATIGAAVVTTLVVFGGIAFALVG